MRSFTLTFTLAFALAFAGCGFEGETIFAGRRVPDVAPWEDLGPLTICDGLSRLGQKSAGPLGTCETGAATACASDGQCASRERCVCGSCRLSVCDTGEECGAGSVCTFDERRCDRACVVDGDCAAGESCMQGKHVCRGTCATTADCQTGETCQSATGLCAVATCQDDSVCFGGRRCALQRVPTLLREPSPLSERGGVTLWLERSDQAGAPGIWRATSLDGIHFSLDPPRALAMGGAPSVTHAARGYLMIFAAPDGSLARAESPDGAGDGVSFAVDARPVVAAGDAPSLVVLPDGSYALYFVTPAGVFDRATSPDGVTFTDGGPVLAPAQVNDPVLWRDVDRIASPFAEALTGVDGKPFVRLWFSAHGTESGPSVQFGKSMPTPPDFSIGEAASADGVAFTPYPFNPVFDRVLEFLTHPSELEPAVVRLGDSQLLYYRRAAADGTQSENLAVARSPVQPQ